MFPISFRIVYIYTIYNIFIYLPDFTSVTAVLPQQVIWPTKMCVSRRRTRTMKSTVERISECLRNAGREDGGTRLEKTDRRACEQRAARRRGIPDGGVRAGRAPTHGNARRVRLHPFEKLVPPFAAPWQRYPAIPAPPSLSRQNPYTCLYIYIGT